MIKFFRRYGSIICWLRIPITICIRLNEGIILTLIIITAIQLESRYVLIIIVVAIALEFYGKLRTVINPGKIRLILGIRRRTGSRFEK